MVLIVIIPSAMPEVDGYGVLAAIRAEPETAMMTGNSHKDTRTRKITKSLCLCDLVAKI